MLEDQPGVELPIDALTAFKFDGVMEIAKIECYVTDRLCLREIFVYTRGWFLLFGWLVGFFLFPLLVFSLSLYLSLYIFLSFGILSSG